MIFSADLYNFSDQVASVRFENLMLKYFVTKEDDTKRIFASLINIVFSYNPIGWGIPYNHVYFADHHEEV